MKRFLTTILLIALAGTASAQLLSEKTSDKVTLGYDVYTDFQTNLKNITSDYDARAINQGFNFFATYNFNVGESKHIFAIGAGLSTHNYFSNARINDIYSDSLSFVICDNDNFKRSKINLTYFDVPMELRFRIKDQWKIGIGFKVGINIASKTKFVGTIDNQDVKVKYFNINGVEEYIYGLTFRVGWKWINLFANYQLSNSFKESSCGPAINPLSVGITIVPF